ncbi:RNA-directed DNA polymerase [Rhizobium leguminosarum]|jgi:RNA-directed DNA polymerase|uniref:reverse transcriptase family protein n=1 Tax=Rhizobium leguminosarum TaxID=384 RepID=UPI001031C160|nr:reverse transcriptase family protein [Rhizobium leguminosarum]TAX39876.1 RNA-directed DNA polymerase [Rhizobium leguminosarum]TAX92758.1 RNA-directed DNA polymerase [Rhizobium leguminosarum]
MLITREIDLVLDENLGVAAKENISAYCGKLSERGLPAILSADHFSLMIGVDGRYIYGVSNNADRYYRVFQLPKRREGFRTICEPLPILKMIQRWILDNILSKIPPAKCVNSYIVGRSIKSNARLHLGQESLIKLDVKDFFGSISSHHVYKLFFDLGYTKAVSVFLSRLCTYKGFLPQGSPTSGSISNLVLRGVDEALLTFCTERKIRYTRYADDMCFSGTNIAAPDLIEFVRKNLGELGLKLNNDKMRILKQSHRQIVTGIVVNKRLAVPRLRRQRLRQEIYYLKKFGFVSHAMNTDDSDPVALLRRLIGECAFLMHIHSKDVVDIRDIEFLKALLREELARQRHWTNGDEDLF